MFKIRKIKILIIIFLLGIMLFSCDYPMGGKMIELYGKERCEAFAEYVIENGATVRQTAAHFGIC